MTQHLLVVSHKKEDRHFAEALQSKGKFEVFNAITKNEIRNYLIENPSAFVLWNAENLALYESSGDILPKYAKQQNIFAITEDDLSKYPHLYKSPSYGHHLFRRFKVEALSLYENLLDAIADGALGFEKYFPRSTQIKRVVITKPAHKNAAIEAIQNALTKQGIRGKIAGLVAQATDELIMNAIIHAPVNPDGSKKERSLRADGNFELEEREHVDVQLAESESYMGICVSDEFGTLKRKMLMDALRRHFEKTVLSAARAEAGLGINGILKAGLSLMVVVKPRQCTEMMLFFPKAENYKEFRSGFRFFGVAAE